jgi:hypothetical protein
MGNKNGARVEAAPVKSLHSIGSVDFSRLNEQLRRLAAIPTFDFKGASREPLSERWGTTMGQI